MKKFLVTGGSGFIGTNFINYLLNAGNQVLNLDIHEPRLNSHFPYWKQVDLCDASKLEQQIKAFAPEIVIHLGARTDLNGKTLDDYKANTVGVENLLNVLDKIPSLKQAVFTSSMLVCRIGYKPKTMDDYQPSTVYGESKVLTEKIIKERNPFYTWSIVRPTSIWGPFFGTPYADFFQMVLAKKYFHLGKKVYKKTYGYIDNVIYQINAILTSPPEKVNRQVFYLGDYQTYDTTEWANEIAAAENEKIKTIPYFIFVIASWVGDALKKLKISFPMNSFRLRNMTTENVLDLSATKEVAPTLPVDRKEGNRRTIEWLKAKN